MNSAKLASKLTALVLASMLFVAASPHAAPLTTCSLQNDCVRFEVTRVDPPEVCAASCEYRVCTIVDFAASGSCVKSSPDVLSRLCEKSPTQCSDVSDFSDSFQTESVPDQYVSCQVVSPGGSAQFVYKDSTCSGLPGAWPTSVGDATASCAPGNAGGSCNTTSGCIWTIVAPTECPAPPTTTSTTTTTTTSTTTSTTLPPLCGAAPEPAVNCRLNAAGKGQLLIKDKTASTPEAADQFKWKWGNGDATALVDFMDPVGGSAEYRVCLYQDVSGSPAKILELDLLPGGTCADKPCWAAFGPPEAPKGFQYKDKDAATDGVAGVKLQAGDAGKAQVQVKGKGIHLPMPVLPLQGDVTVQLVIDDGPERRCFQTSFPAPHASNVPGSFKAKGP